MTMSLRLSSLQAQLKALASISFYSVHIMRVKERSRFHNVTRTVHSQNVSTLGSPFPRISCIHHASNYVADIHIYVYCHRIRPIYYIVIESLIFLQLSRRKGC